MMGFEKLEELKQTLASEAKAVEKNKEKQTKSVDRIVHIIARLQKHFPKAFPKNPLPKVPLKVGILDDLISRSKEIGISEADLRDALQTWCRTRRYSDSMKFGAKRLDLDGFNTGEVKAHEVVHAKTQRNGNTPGDTVSSSE
jgi:ProP effector